MRLGHTKGPAMKLELRSQQVRTLDDQVHVLERVSFGSGKPSIKAMAPVEIHGAIQMNK